MRQQQIHARKAQAQRTCRCNCHICCIRRQSVTHIAQLPPCGKVCARQHRHFRPRAGTLLRSKPALDRVRAIRGSSTASFDPLWATASSPSRAAKSTAREFAPFPTTDSARRSYAARTCPSRTSARTSRPGQAASIRRCVSVCMRSGNIRRQLVGAARATDTSALRSLIWLDENRIANGFSKTQPNVRIRQRRSRRGVFKPKTLAIALRDQQHPSRDRKARSGQDIAGIGFVCGKGCCCVAIQPEPIAENHLTAAIRVRNATDMTKPRLHQKLGATGPGRLRKNMQEGPSRI